MRIRKRFLLISTDPLINPNNTPTNLEEPNLNKDDQLGINYQEEAPLMKQHDINFSKEPILVEQPSVRDDLQPCSHQEDRWGDKDKVIPLKKRRGNFDQNLVVNSTSTDNVDDHEYDNKSVMTKKLKPKKIKIRGNVIMEGSRCSRVNGRGWRCFQQTLVGYSLCEHHLGKGRIIKSVTTNLPHVKKDIETISESDDETGEGKDDHHDKQLSMSCKTGKMKKKKKNRMVMKLGKVKARSISSLMGKP